MDLTNSRYLLYYKQRERERRREREAHFDLSNNQSLPYYKERERERGGRTEEAREKQFLSVTLVG